MPSFLSLGRTTSVDSSSAAFCRLRVTPYPPPGAHQIILPSFLSSGPPCSFLTFRRSHCVPGLFLLSLSLSALRRIFQGSLSFSIGFHAGMMSTIRIVVEAGLVAFTSSPNRWLMGAYSVSLKTGPLGQVLLVAALVALGLYCHRRASAKTSQRPS